MPLDAGQAAAVLAIVSDAQRGSLGRALRVPVMAGPRQGLRRRAFLA